MPAQHIIDGHKGVIDYYLWRGIPCARSWPYWRPRAPTAPEKYNQDDFAYINRLWGSIPPRVQNLYRAMAVGTPLTGKDIFVKAYMNGITYTET